MVIVLGWTLLLLGDVALVLNLMHLDDTLDSLTVTALNFEKSNGTLRAFLLSIRVAIKLRFVFRGRRMVHVSVAHFNVRANALDFQQRGTGRRVFILKQSAFVNE